MKEKELNELFFQRKELWRKSVEYYTLMVQYNLFHNKVLLELLIKTENQVEEITKQIQEILEA